ncbi:unnamed protein product [Rhizoctonia solani]|uniref:Uncharacterized protein n=1 Tax=Rhizoctonia solani TaxID=456999 RepID=A0A8H3BXV5_9AGAM|nr:unnamed protein product [Rhizoctonia solani]
MSTGWLVRLKKPRSEFNKTTGGPSKKMSDAQKEALIQKLARSNTVRYSSEEVKDACGTQDKSDPIAKGNSDSGILPELAPMSGELNVHENDGARDDLAGQPIRAVGNLVPEPGIGCMQEVEACLGANAGPKKRKGQGANEEARVLRLRRNRNAFSRMSSD